eukprot:1064576-Prorocentrum_minimum.AAC.1
MGSLTSCHPRCAETLKPKGLNPNAGARGFGSFAGRDQHAPRGPQPDAAAEEDAAGRVGRPTNRATRGCKQTNTFQAAAVPRAARRHPLRHAVSARVRGGGLKVQGGECKGPRWVQGSRAVGSRVRGGGFKGPGRWVQASKAVGSKVRGGGFKRPRRRVQRSGAAGSRVQGGGFKGPGRR